ncbi:hypothetical protein RIX35_003585 [Salmonella enterica]|nr:hypothetical protein [Salmonella enterica]
MYRTFWRRAATKPDTAIAGGRDTACDSNLNQPCTQPVEPLQMHQQYGTGPSDTERPNLPNCGPTEERNGEALTNHGPRQPRPT